ncbi:MAG: hypothetical protein U1E78_05720 [Gammaproteobacteria bacterium]
MKVQCKQILFSILLSAVIGTVQAEAIVIEGAKAQTIYDEQKGIAQILVQKNKVFTLRHQGQEEEKPDEINVKVGETFFIVNEEDKFIHNVYDLDDESWILKKQEPGGIAAIRFEEEGPHALRCAIHPTMKTLIKVNAE